MNEPAKRVMPKGGRKGGAIFPRIALKDAVDYAKKLVSKSHTAPITRDVLFSGVLGAKGGIGDTRASAVKQYGLMVGDQKSGFSAGELAKKVSVSPPEELLPLLRQAALSPTIFKAIFDTFHGDAVTRAKLKQRAAGLKVHPDQADACVDLYVKTMEFAGLVAVEGDKIVHVPSSSLGAKPHDEELQKKDEEEAGESEAESSEDDAVDDNDDGESESDAESGGVVGKVARRPAPPKAIININVSLDSTTDSDKLAKQLALLRKYGAL
jgi:hypothetical protein